MASFIPFNRDQAFLLPPDLKSWLPDDDLAHFVVAARGGGGRACAVLGVRGAGTDWRQAAIPSTADAGAADPLLCQRHLLVAADRAGDLA